MHPGIPERKRGGCLTAYLVVIAIINVLVGALFGILGLQNLDWIILLGAMLTVVNVVFVIGIWKWKKWGVYGLGVTLGLGITAALISMQFSSAVPPLSSLAVLIYLVRPVWHLME